jgi:hypothetical protein
MLRVTFLLRLTNLIINRPPFLNASHVLKLLPNSLQNRCTGKPLLR